MRFEFVVKTGAIRNKTSLAAGSKQKGRFQDEGMPGSA